MKRGEVDLEVQGKVKGDLNVDDSNRNIKNSILSLTDLYDVLPFGKTKINKLVKSGQLPVLKIGRDYITTYSILEKWISDNIGQEIYY